MKWRDRFFTPTTARAILSWRLAVGAAAAAVAIAAGMAWPLGLGVGAVLYVGLVAAAMPKGARRPAIDPFALSEPWRQFVQSARKSASKLHETVAGVHDGPLKDRIAGIAQRLDDGLDETWRIARRGDEIDEMVNRLDPTALRSRLATLVEQSAAAPSDELTSAITSLEGQIDTTERLKEQSARTANTLRLSQTRYDELVSRAAEIAIGTGDTESYEHDVEALVIELEALRQAVDETRTA